MANVASKAIKAALRSRAGKVAIAAVATVAERAAHATARTTVKRVQRVVAARQSARAAVASAPIGPASSPVGDVLPGWSPRVRALGSIAVPHALLANHRQLGLDAKDLLLLLHLWRQRGADGVAVVRYEQLSRDSGISRPAVKRRLKRLQEEGLLQERAPASGDPRKSHRFDFAGMGSRVDQLVTPSRPPARATTPPRPAPAPARKAKPARKTAKRDTATSARKAPKRVTAKPPRKAANRVTAKPARKGVKRA